MLQAAAMATKWWEPARDALDTMVLSAARLYELEGYQHTDFMPFDPSVKVIYHLQPQACSCGFKRFCSDSSPLSGNHDHGKAL